MYLAQHALCEHASLYLGITQMVVSLKIDVVHFHFFFLVYIHIQYHLILIGNILTLRNGYLSVFKSFIVEILLGKRFGPVYHVRCYLSALDDTKFGFHIFLF